MLGIVGTAGAITAQEADVSRDDRITPEKLGLPKNCTRTSEPFVTRIYKTDAADQILKKQPDGYPFTIKEDYSLRENETARVHEGVDISFSRRRSRCGKALGLQGRRLRRGRPRWRRRLGAIGVQLRDGSVLQYLHTTASHVKVGEAVSPNTVLGVTGRRGTSAIHLHVEAKDKHGSPVSPDMAFRIGQRKSALPTKIEDGAGADFDPDLYSGVEPSIQGGKVRSKFEPKAKWVVEVIGGGGEVQLTLGEFWTYRDASHCSLRWSEDHPEDLRLTREREVVLSGAGK